MPPKNDKRWPPVAKLSLSSAVDQTVTVSTSGTSPGATGKNRRTAVDSPIVSYEIYWGDGSSAVGTGTPPLTLSHTYAAGSTTTPIVQLTVVAQNTLRATASLQVTLNSAPPDPDPPPPPPPTPPTLTSLVLGDASPTSAQSLTWIATFSEGVQGVTTGAFSLAAVGPVGASITSVAVLSNTSYRITVDRGAGSGSLGLDFTTPTGITAIATGVQASGTVVGAVYTITSPEPPPPTPTPPTCLSIVRAAAPPTSAATVAWTVTFSEAVTGVTLAAFSLATSGLSNPNLASVVAQSTSVYTVTAGVGPLGTGGSLGLNFSTPGGVRDIDNTPATATLVGEIYVIQPVAPPPGSGTTYTAASPDRAAVQAAINLAFAGDTVVIPSGTATWTTAVTITRGITLRGATTSAFGSTTAGTVIINNNSGGAGRLFDITLDPGTLTRISGIYFAESLVNANQGVFRITGFSDQDGSRLRLDHLTMLDFGAPATSAYGIWCQGVLGVIDHCTFRTDQVGHIPIEVQHATWGGQDFGDGSWTEDANLGTERFLFVEDCIGVLNNAGFEAFGDTLVDSLNGSRFVVRYCDVTSMQIGIHGTESGGRQRGGRAFEVYNVVYRGTIPGAVAVHNRSGVSVAFNLEFRSMFYPNIVHFLEAKRLTTLFSPWGSADGTNVADVNVPGGPFATGTCTSGAPGILTDTTKNWTPNQWVGYSLKLTSGCTAGIGQETCATIIIANTATQLTLLIGGYPPGPITPAAGNTYQIWRVSEALDQPGVGTGSLITADPPVFPPGWNNQALDTCYSWNWTSPDGTAGPFSWGTYEPAQIRLGEHYAAWGTVKPGYTPYPYPHPLTQTV